jgi:DNA-binding MarR family transcriptional regulator
VPPPSQTANALQVWNLFQQSYLLTFRHLEQIANREGLSYSQAAALGVLNASDRPLPLSHLARYLTQEAQSTTELADRLERRGLVRRTRDPRDRRLVLLELTADGQTLADRIAPELAEGSEQVFQALDERGRGALIESLTPVRDRAAEVLGLDERRLKMMSDPPRPKSGNGARP